MFGIEHKVADAVRRAGIVTASAVLTLVGAAFLTVAAWLYLSAEHSALFAAVVIGCVYTGAGLLTLALGSSARGVAAKRHRPRDPLNGLSPAQLVLISFLQGLDQGRKTRR